MVPVKHINPCFGQLKKDEENLPVKITYAKTNVCTSQRTRQQVPFLDRPQQFFRDDGQKIYSNERKGQASTVSWT